MVALVGAPVDADGASYIATVRLDKEGSRTVYLKTWLGEDEARRFSPGAGPVVTEVDGWRVGLAICKDTGAAQHTVGTASTLR